MVIQNRDRLHSLAEEHCKRALLDLVEVPPRITSGPEDGPAWDSVLRRWTYTADFKAWRSFDSIEMKFDAEGRVKSFRDAQRMLPQGEMSAAVDSDALTDKAILSICATSGLVEESAVILDRSALGPYLLTVEVQQGPIPQLVSYVVHLVTKKLAALEVEES